jgi:hypothetical protein
MIQCPLYSQERVHTGVLDNLVQIETVFLSFGLVHGRKMWLYGLLLHFVDALIYGLHEFFVVLLVSRVF